MAADVHTGSRLLTGPRRPQSRVELLGALVGYHVTVFRRIWKSMFVSRVVTPVLFLLAMGLGVGGLVERASGGVDGVPYLQWVVPGIVMSSVMQWAVGESTWPVLTYIKWNQMYTAMLTAPTTVADVILAHWFVIAAGVVASGTIFIGVAALFGAVASWWAVLGMPIGVLVAMAFVAPLFWVAARAESDESFTSIFRLVVTPLMLFSGTFFPIEQLPGWLQPIAWVTPLWHGTELARPAFLGDPVADRWWLHLGVLAAYVVVGWVLTRRAFEARLAS